MELEVSTIRKSKFRLWNKRIHFEVTYADVMDYYYSLGDLVSGLIDLGIPSKDIYVMINNIERKYYKIK